MLHLAAQDYYGAAPPVVAVARVVEIVMAPEATMCNTERNASEADAAVQELETLIAAKAVYTGDCGFPGAHVVIPTPDQAECQA